MGTVVYMNVEVDVGLEYMVDTNIGDILVVNCMYSDMDVGIQYMRKDPAVIAEEDLVIRRLDIIIDIMDITTHIDIADSADAEVNLKKMKQEKATWGKWIMETPT